MAHTVPAEVAGEALLVPDAGLVGGDPFQIENFAATLLTSRFDIIAFDVSKFRRIDDVKGRSKAFIRLFVDPLTAQYASISGASKFAAMTPLELEKNCFVTTTSVSNPLPYFFWVATDILKIKIETCLQ